MVVEALITSILALVGFFLSLIPDLPDIPQPIVDAANSMLSYVEKGGDIAVGILGQTFWDALLAIGIALLLFEPIYHVSIWVLRKLPLPIH